MTDLHLLVPAMIDDPARPSGGNTYDRRVAAGLRALGWTVREHLLPGTWPQPEEPQLATLAQVLADLPRGAALLVDGLIASCAPDVIVPEAERLRVVVLVHMPLGLRLDAETPATTAARTAENRMLSAAAAVVTTSQWTRRRLLELYGLPPDRLAVARPGVDAAPIAVGTKAGGELLCVAAVTPAKGQDRLVAALTAVADLDWRCVCAGSLDLDPDFVTDVREQVRRAGFEDRVRFVGPLGPPDLSRAYATADLLVHASRAETYGMVATEALARGLPVVAMAVGGLPEAMGTTGSAGATGATSTDVPGVLVPDGDTEGFAAALRLWLGDPEARQRLRAAARSRRAELASWSRTAHEVSEALRRVAPA